MKKIIISLSLILCITLQVTGCTKQKTENIIKENKKIETTVKNIEQTIRKTKNQVREIAYKSLNEVHSKTIIDWQLAKVEEHKYTTDHTVVTQNGKKNNLRDKEAYKVDFKNTKEGMLGLLTIYVDKYSYSILGMDLRD